MDWLAVGWTWFWMPGNLAGWDVAGFSPVSGSRLDLPELDLRLIQVTYEFVAALSTCGRCQAPLRRQISVTGSAGGISSTASVVTKCGGWRRHRHVATVTESANHLALGPFRAK